MIGIVGLASAAETVWTTPAVEMAVNKATKKRRLGSVLKSFMGDLFGYRKTPLIGRIHPDKGGGMSPSGVWSITDNEPVMNSADGCKAFLWRLAFGVWRSAVHIGFCFQKR
jgi:hypothetical protein